MYTSLQAAAFVAVAVGVFVAVCVGVLVGAEVDLGQERNSAAADRMCWSAAADRMCWSAAAGRPSPSGVVVGSTFVFGMMLYA